MNHEERRLLAELVRRKATKEDPCESCDSSWRSSDGHGLACWDCLGQGVLLSAEERQAIMSIAGYVPGDLDNDYSISAQQHFD